MPNLKQSGIYPDTDAFAAEIKSKLPVYKDWNNDWLVGEVLNKHPEYRSWLPPDVVNNTMAAHAMHKPVGWEGIKAAVTHPGVAYKEAFEPKVSPEEVQAHPIKTAAELLGLSLISPVNVGLMAAIPEESAGRIAGPALDLMKALFGGQMIGGAAGEAYQRAKATTPGEKTYHDIMGAAQLGLGMLPMIPGRMPGKAPLTAEEHLGKAAEALGIQQKPPIQPIPEFTQKQLPPPSQIQVGPSPMEAELTKQAATAGPMNKPIADLSLALEQQLKQRDAVAQTPPPPIVAPAAEQAIQQAKVEQAGIKTEQMRAKAQADTRQQLIRAKIAEVKAKEAGVKAKEIKPPAQRPGFTKQELVDLFKPLTPEESAATQKGGVSAAEAVAAIKARQTAAPTPAKPIVPAEAQREKVRQLFLDIADGKLATRKAQREALGVPLDRVLSKEELFKVARQLARGQEAEIPGMRKGRIRIRGLTGRFTGAEERRTAAEQRAWQEAAMPARPDEEEAIQAGLSIGKKPTMRPAMKPEDLESPETMVRKAAERGEPWAVAALGQAEKPKKIIPPSRTKLTPEEAEARHQKLIDEGRIKPFVAPTPEEIFPAEPEEEAETPIETKANPAQHVQPLLEKGVPKEKIAEFASQISKIKLPFEKHLEIHEAVLKTVRDALDEGASVEDALFQGRRQLAIEQLNRGVEISDLTPDEAEKGAVLFGKAAKPLDKPLAAEDWKEPRLIYERAKQLGWKVYPSSDELIKLNKPNGALVSPDGGYIVETKLGESFRGPQSQHEDAINAIAEGTQKEIVPKALDHARDAGWARMAGANSWDVKGNISDGLFDTMERMLGHSPLWGKVAANFDWAPPIGKRLSFSVEPEDYEELGIKGGFLKQLNKLGHKMLSLIKEDSGTLTIKDPFGRWNKAEEHDPILSGRWKTKKYIDEVLSPGLEPIDTHRKADDLKFARIANRGKLLSTPKINKEISNWLDAQKAGKAVPKLSQEAQRYWDWEKPLRDEELLNYTELKGAGALPEELAAIDPSYLSRRVINRGRDIERALLGSRWTTPRLRTKTGSMLPVRIYALEDNKGNIIIAHIRGGTPIHLRSGNLPEEMGGEIRFKKGVTTPGDVAERQVKGFNRRIQELDKERRILTRSKFTALRHYRRLVNIAEERSKLNAQIDQVWSNIPQEAYDQASYLDKSGKLWKVRHATLDEIEAQTDLRYLRDPLFRRISNVLALRQANRVSKIMTEQIKGLTDVGLAAEDKVGSPKDFRRTQLPHGRGMVFDPQIAHTLDAFWRQYSKRGDFSVLTKLNRFVVNAMFWWNPYHTVTNVGIGRWLPEKFQMGSPLHPFRFAKADYLAYKDLATSSNAFIQAVAEGAGFSPHGRMLSEGVGTILHERLVKELDANAPLKTKIAKLFGIPVKEVGGYLSHVFSHWHDFLVMQDIREKMLSGMSLKEAVRISEEMMPSYKMSASVLSSPELSKVLDNPNVSLFAKWKYNQFTRWTKMVSQLASREGMDARGRAFKRILAIGFIYSVLYPQVFDKFVQWVSGDKRTMAARGGIFALPSTTVELATNRITLTRAAKQVWQPAPTLELATQLATGRQDFSGRHIFGETAKEMPGEAARFLLPSLIAPAGYMERMREGSTTPREVLGSYLGARRYPGSPALATAKRLFYSKLPTEARKESELERLKPIREIYRDLQNARTPEERSKVQGLVSDAMSRGLIAPAKANELMLRSVGVTNELESLVKRLDVTDALMVYSRLTDEDVRNDPQVRAKIRMAILQKGFNKLQKATNPKEIDRLLQQLEPLTESK